MLNLVMTDNHWAIILHTLFLSRKLLDDGQLCLQLLLFDLFELIRESFDSIFILPCNQ